jgi:hypothetical protein
VLRGRELGLFRRPRSATSIARRLDCVQACPHDNIALVIRTPGAELIEDGRRAGIGRLDLRPDLAALAAVFTFGALLSAFAMTAPARAVERRLADILSLSTPGAGLAVLFLLGIGLLPIALVTGSAAVTHVLAGAGTRTLQSTAVRYVHALVPLGVGVWLAHYGFHLLTGALTVVPVTQSAVIDLVGRPMLGEPWWLWVGMHRQRSRCNLALSWWVRWADWPRPGDVATRPSRSRHSGGGAMGRARQRARRRGLVDPRPADGHARREPARMKAYLWALGCAACILVVSEPSMSAHDGPPFPIVSDPRARRLNLTDPDSMTTAPGGQFWVQLRMVAPATALPSTTRASISVRPVIRTAPMRTVTAAPVAGDASNQFGALVLDHEGRFAVEVTIDGPAGPALVEAEVDATYDLRPPPFMLAVYALPFLIAGVLWVKLLVRRTRGPRSS